MEPKNEKGSLSLREKEPVNGEDIKERILSLVGGRSRLEATRDWGINYSTFKNYIKRASVPRSLVLSKIAENEGVSIEWLMYGVGQGPEKEKKEEVNERTGKRKKKDTSLVSFTSSPKESNRADLSAWGAVLDAMGETKSNALLKAILNKGIDASLAALNVTYEDIDNNEEIFKAIDALPIKRTLKQAIKMGVLVNNEDADREILQILKKAERAQSPDAKALEMPEPKRNNG